VVEGTYQLQLAVQWLADRTTNASLIDWAMSLSFSCTT
jgi:hypothetical protein